MERPNAIEEVHSTITIDHRNRACMHTPETVTLYDLTAGVRIKQAKEFAKVLKWRARQRAAKSSVFFTKAAKDRFERAVFDLDLSRWTMDNPPRMVVLKFPGDGMPRSVDEAVGGPRNRTYWSDIAPDYKAAVKALRRFARRFKSAYGMKLDAIWGLQFQRYGNPHFHLLLTVPVHADGTEMLSNHPRGRRIDYSRRFNHLRFWEFVERTWADILGVRYDVSNPAEHGRVTFTARADEVKPADSIQDYVERFVWYLRLDDKVKYADKLHQQFVPPEWEGQQVSFWGILGFTHGRRTADAPLVLECRTQEAEAAVRRFFARLAGTQPVYEEFDGVAVDISYWSNERRRLRGGSFYRPLTNDEIMELRRILAVANALPDRVLPSDDYLATWEAETYREPIRRNSAYLTALRAAAPAAWERDDWDLDAYLAAQDAADAAERIAEDAYRDAMLALDETTNSADATAAEPVSGWAAVDAAGRDWGWREQLTLAKSLGFRSWPQLQSHLAAAGQTKQYADAYGG
ncbi:hypothetical protein ACFQ36_07040 [Arthrobacter sp. GCM10027362]|uniref:hypothetical protein n=1 Tax=Arthrobacter sp. GCM10027362 TaxID=3273379 RepID=UPI0036278FBE